MAPLSSSKQRRKTGNSINRGTLSWGSAARLGGLSPRSTQAGRKGNLCGLNPRQTEVPHWKQTNKRVCQWLASAKSRCWSIWECASVCWCNRKGRGKGGVIDNHSYNVKYLCMNRFFPLNSFLNSIENRFFHIIYPNYYFPSLNSPPPMPLPSRSTPFLLLIREQTGFWGIIINKIR